MYQDENDETEALWIKVEGSEGEENYYVDETFELEWEGIEYTYAVLVRECDFSGYSRGEEILPDLMRYSTDRQELVEIEDDHEKAFVVDAINAYYQADIDSNIAPA